MESVRVGRRMTRQQAVKEKSINEKTSCLFVRRSSRLKTATKDANVGVVKLEDDDEDDVMVVDESVYLKRIAALKLNSVQQNGSVEGDRHLEKDDCKLGDDNGYNEECMVDCGDDEEGKDFVKDEKNDEGSDDDSLQIIGERWNPGFCYESHSSVTSSDLDSDGAEDEVACSSEMVQVNCRQSDVRPWSSGRKGEEIDEKDGHNRVRNETVVYVGSSDGSRLKSRDGNNETKSKRVSDDDLFGKRYFDGLVLPVEPENNALEDDFVGRRTRSHSSSKLHRSKRGDGTFSCPVAIDDDSSCSSDGDKDDGREALNNHKSKNAKSCGKSGRSKRGRPRKRTYVKAKLEPEPELESEPELELEPEVVPVPEMKFKPEHVPEIDSKHEVEHVPEIDSEPDHEPDIGAEPELESELIPVSEIESKPEHVPEFHCMPDVEHVLVNDSEPEHEPQTNAEPRNCPKLPDNKVCENVVKRKRGRPPKNRNEGTERRRPMKKRKLKDNKVENTLLDTILENGNARLETDASLKSEPFIPLKFNFRVQYSLPEKTEEEAETEGLFNDLDFALRVCDVGCTASSSDEDEENDDVLSYDGAVMQEKLCCVGKHYLILDDEVGIRCKYCAFVKLEIRNVTPAFDDEPFGRSEKKTKYWLYYNEYIAAVSNGLRIPEFNGTEQILHSDSVQGTVWDLVPGIKKSLYPHQREAFEFIWRNVGGSTKLDELGKPTNFRIGGCIICHAPGTGKTRLAITFLKSFLNKYPMSKPVIISPRSMLLTWEEEFARWNIDVPFHNLNKTELSGREDKEVLKYTAKNLWTIRKAKLCSWAKGNGILGVSYRLFEELAGDRKGTDKSIQRALLEQPGILVLDEGHTPRNDDSNIWNVLTKVNTKKRIILSGTPFQNNFEELHNTLSLVREEFRNPLLLGGYLDSDRRIVELKKRMKPFVHVHKGEILKKTLRGLYHSVLFLKPSDLQKTCCQQLAGVKYIVEQNHLVSVACVHPSLLAACNQVPDSIDKVQLEKHKEDVEVGLKIRFLFELINLVIGEKILVFSQYIPPLKFISSLLKSRYHWTEGKEFICMHGQQDTKQRQSFINTYNDPNSEVRVLLASTKACGEGIHLVGASRVVLLDVVWNPSVERQAISRAYRIGQSKDVFVYHLILSGTLEEKKYYRLVNKDRLSELVFAAEGESNQKMSIVSQVSKDRALEEMIENEKTNAMFVRIIRESKADELIKSFNPVKL
ncbi:hypothetical protein vseg_020378 [Gypsophila vaccaria]